MAFAPKHWLDIARTVECSQIIALVPWDVWEINWFLNRVVLEKNQVNKVFMK